MRDWIRSRSFSAFSSQSPITNPSAPPHYATNLRRLIQTAQFSCSSRLPTTTGFARACCPRPRFANAAPRLYHRGTATAGRVGSSTAATLPSRPSYPAKWRRRSARHRRPRCAIRNIPAWSISVGAAPTAKPICRIGFSAVAAARPRTRGALTKEIRPTRASTQRSSDSPQSIEAVFSERRILPPQHPSFPQPSGF